MYSEEDINSAVAAGALSAEAAANLRNHVAATRELPRVDEENFRLVNSFNDIFVAIGVVILLLAAGAIGQQLAGLFVATPALAGQNPTDAEFSSYLGKRAAYDGVRMLIGGALVAATAWLLAEFFTRRRRMALPSILLLLAFVGAVFAAITGLGRAMRVMEGDMTGALFLSGTGLLAAFAAWRHWKRFKVPITVAAGAAALSVTVIAFFAGIVDAAGGSDGGEWVLPLVAIAGLAVFALAMRWDMSDRTRTTRRSDVAFWLHLLAAPMIAHPLFTSLGVMDGGEKVGVAAALGVVAVYVLFGLVALAIDRRALLVSALAYVLAALTILFDRFGAVELNFALTALVIGSALLTLSAFWAPMRARVVALLPAEWQARLPVAAVPGVAPA